MTDRTLGLLTRSAGTLEFVTTAPITLVTSIEVTALSPGFDYIFQLEAFAITDDSEALWMRFSDDGGASYEAGATDYAWMFTTQGVAAFDVSDAQIDLTLAIGNDAGNRSTITFTLVNPNSSEETTGYWQGLFMDTDATPVLEDVSGGALFEQGAGVVDAVQFLWSGSSTFKATGNITVWRRRRT